MKNYWKTLLITSLLTLLPIAVGLVLWNKLPQVLATHWGFDGQTDGYGSLPVAVFLPPLSMLAAQWLCVLIAVKDPKNQNRNHKPLALVLWVMPIMSNLCAYIMYALALGVQFSPSSVMIGAIGLMFLMIGNYLPKCRQNYTMGIRVPWTYASEENWNATHRFGGRVWMIGGAVMLLAAFLPGEMGAIVMIAGIVILTAVPTAYSYCYYRRQKQRGDELKPLPRMNTKMGKWGLFLAAILVALVCVLLFTGTVEVVFGEESFTVEASYYSDLTVAYDSVSSVEYREGAVDGVRNFGLGSFRLLLGSFENQEFGRYTRYTYYNPESCVIVRSEGKVLVLSGKNAQETQALYQTLSGKTRG